MTLTGEQLRDYLSSAAFVVSVFSVYLTRLNWKQSNRPVVSAYIMEHSSGNMAAPFNLVVANTGNRPAVRVRLNASYEQIMTVLETGVAPDRYKLIESNFSPESEIPLLKNGEELSTSFGAIVNPALEGPWLRYGAQFEVTVRYEDLERRKYVSHQPLKVYAREGFGGGVWKDRD